MIVAGGGHAGNAIVMEQILRENLADYVLEVRVKKAFLILSIIMIMIVLEIILKEFIRKKISTCWQNQKVISIQFLIILKI